MPAPDRKDIHSWEKAMLSTHLGAMTKLVLLILKHSTNTFGDMTWPSQELIAARCSLSKRAVITHLQVAEKAGWIKCVKLSQVAPMIAEQSGRKPVKRKSIGKDWAAKAYECCWPNGQNETQLPQVKDVHPISGGRGERRACLGVKDVHPTSIVNKHPTLNNPKKNPLPPEPVDNVDKFGVVKNLKMGKTAYRISVVLSDAGWEAARRVAPNWDLHRLAAIYDDGVEQRGIPKFPDKAFAAWCAKYTKGVRL
jgi:hypothetical protein